MKTVALWYHRTDAPYKSRLWGMWVVEAEEVTAIVEQIRSVEDWEETPVVEVDSAPEPYSNWGDDGYLEGVVYVYDFVPGLLHSGDGYGSYPEFFYV